MFINYFAWYIYNIKDIYSLQTWKYDNSWLYCIDYLGLDDHEFDVRYRFKVRWSVPTRRKPIPRATACVYFTFQVSKIKPKVKCTWILTVLKMIENTKDKMEWQYIFQNLTYF